MRLIVKRGGQLVGQYEFQAGAVHIGRHARSQVLLMDRAVSRHHAVIYLGPEGRWLIEDLDSANKTYLNDRAVHRAQLQDGDKIRIADFEIEVQLYGEGVDRAAVALEDTLVTVERKCQIIRRRPSEVHAPEVRMPASRINDFLRATEVICKSGSPEQVAKTLVDIAMGQFEAFEGWAALRTETQGPMLCNWGQRKTTGMIQLQDIVFQQYIREAVEQSVFLLLPQLGKEQLEPVLGSMMAGPIVDLTGCFGALYMARKRGTKPFSLSDLDYMMLLSIHTAAVVENF